MTPEGWINEGRRFLQREEERLKVQVLLDWLKPSAVIFRLSGTAP